MNRKRKEEEKERQESIKFRTCGKKSRYATEQDALQAGKRVNFYNYTEIEFKAYFCRYCKQYHLTSV